MAANDIPPNLHLSYFDQEHAQGQQQIEQALRADDPQRALLTLMAEFLCDMRCALEQIDCNIELVLEQLTKRD